MSHPSVPAISSQSPRLLDLVRQLALGHFGRPEPGERYAEWVRRFVLFHQKRHPCQLSAADVEQFLVHVAHTEKEALAGLEQACGDEKGDRHVYYCGQPLCLTV